MTLNQAHPAAVFAGASSKTRTLTYTEQLAPGAAVTVRLDDKL